MCPLKRHLIQFKQNIVGILGKMHSMLKIGFIKLVVEELDNRSNFPNQLAIAAIFKDEGSYLKEWIEYHRLIGVTKFYLFDNESTDNSTKILEQYKRDGIVELRKIKGKGRQIDAYQRAIKLAKNETKWLAVIDLDEFILPLEPNKTVLDILEEQKRSALLVGWMIYGSNGYLHKPNGLVVDNYRYHAPDNFIADYKSIINPRKVLEIKNPHYFKMLGKTTDETGKRIFQYPYINRPEAVPASKKKIRINHYYSKSWDEFQLKSLRGYADCSSKVARNIENFKDHDQNEVSDHYMDQYIIKLKQKLK